VIIDNSWGLNGMFENIKCFYCDKLLNQEEGIVHWTGSDGKNLDLHRDCANYLAVNLIQDSIKGLKVPHKFGVEK